MINNDDILTAVDDGKYLFNNTDDCGSSVGGGRKTFSLEYKDRCAAIGTANCILSRHPSSAATLPL